jgi:hypothetical protein
LHLNCAAAQAAAKWNISIWAVIVYIVLLVSTSVAQLEYQVHFSAASSAASRVSDHWEHWHHSTSMGKVGKAAESVPCYAKEILGKVAHGVNEGFFYSITSVLLSELLSVNSLAAISKTFSEYKMGTSPIRAHRKSQRL